MPPRKTPSPPAPPSVYRIYCNPTDYPGQYIVRRLEMSFAQEPPVPVPTKDLTAHTTLDDARASLPPWTYNLGRGESDDESLVETWV